MDNNIFKELLLDLHEEELALHQGKHDQYAAKQSDTLRNFHDGANAMMQSAMEYCLTLLEKHRQALLLNARGETHETIAAVRERVRDIRLYMALFLGLKYDSEFVDPPASDYPKHATTHEVPRHVEEVAKTPTPELDRMLEVAETSQEIGFFLDWLRMQGMVVAQDVADPEHAPLDQLVPIAITKEKLLAWYFGIDLNKVEEERRALLAALNC